MIALIVHGGATTVAAEEIQAYMQGCRDALEAGWARLTGGRSALDAVEFAVRAFEADPTFNAGYGGALTAAGQVELDAALMEGAELRFGAVASSMGLPHPVSVARRLLEVEGVRVLAAHGALAFARAHNLELCQPDDLITDKQRAKLAQQGQGQHDTVGCIALDASGLLAVATSTGGLSGAPPGRIGDSPMPGNGFYVDNTIGGIAFSGDGEQIAQLVLAKTTVDHMATAVDPQAAAQAAIKRLQERVDGEGGCIVLTRDGRIGWAHNSTHMPCAYRTSEMQQPAVLLQHRNEPIKD